MLEETPSTQPTDCTCHVKKILFIKNISPKQIADTQQIDIIARIIMLIQLSPFFPLLLDKLGQAEGEWRIGLLQLL